MAKKNNYYEGSNPLNSVLGAIIPNAQRDVQLKNAEITGNVVDVYVQEKRAAIAVTGMKLQAKCDKRIDRITEKLNQADLPEELKAAYQSQIAELETTKKAVRAAFVPSK